jgi:hypothetical protein
MGRKQESMTIDNEVERGPTFKIGRSQRLDMEGDLV